ncbi:MAG: sensor histidine kinase [Solirubrobacteraceae bacterium]
MGSTALSLRARRLDQGTLDWLVAGLLAVWGQIDLWVAGGKFTTVPGPRGLAAPFLLLFALPLGVRRRWPLGVLCVVMGAIATESLVVGKAPEGGEVLFPALIVFYTVAAHCDLRRALAGFAIAMVGATIATAKDPTVLSLADIVIGDAFFYLFLGGAAWLVGRYARARRLEAAESSSRADRVEREQKEREHAAVSAERTRIARELHDVIAHSVSLMGVQAGAAERVLEHDPDRAREALRSIQLTARESVGELRHLLSFLRAEAEPATLAPQPGIDAIAALVEQARQSGLPVELAIEPETAHVPRGIELSAYRVVQEALTNVRKHAPGASARVVVRKCDRGIDVVVENEPPAAANGSTTRPLGTGSGIPGMRERVTLYGGSLDAARRSDGGFVVRAHIPVESNA